MNRFEEILKASLERINEGYFGAEKDLFSSFEELSAAIRSNIGGNIEVGLEKVLEQPSGTVYRLTIDTEPEDMDAPLTIITSFQVSRNGYPVSFGTFLKSTSSFKQLGVLTDRDELQGHLADQLSDPDSKLIQTIGFALRKRRSSY